MRDTDRDWLHLGAAEPYFGVLSGPEYLLQNLTQTSKAGFFASGEIEVEHMRVQLEKLYGPALPRRHAFDFGCGVGRLVLPLARICDRVTGLDVSPGMLALARRNCEAHGVDNADFLLDAFPDEPADWVNSFLVFQHIVPERGIVLLRRLLACLAPGGVATLHVTAYRTNAHLSASLEDVRHTRFDGRMLVVVDTPETFSEGRMRMYDYDMTMVLAAFVEAGLHGLHLEHHDHGGCHAFRIYGRKTT